MRAPDCQWQCHAEGTQGMLCLRMFARQCSLNRQRWHRSTLILDLVCRPTFTRQLSSLTPKSAGLCLSAARAAWLVAWTTRGNLASFWLVA